MTRANQSNVRRFMEGLRVRNVGWQFQTGIPTGMAGTVSKVAGSIYADPAKRMVFVRWDGGQHAALFRHELDYETEPRSFEREVG